MRSFAASVDTTVSSAGSPAQVKPRIGQTFNLDDGPVTADACRYYVNTDGVVVGADCRCTWCADSDDTWGAE